MDLVVARADSAPAARLAASAANSAWRWARTCSGAEPLGAKSTRTPSTPSSEVPDIRPMNTVLIGTCGLRPRHSPGAPGGLRRRRLLAETALRQRLGDAELGPDALRQLARAASWRPASGRRASEDCATSSGSCCTPSILTSKCRCGPVAQPVWPTAPIVVRPARPWRPWRRRRGSGAHRPSSGRRCA